MRMQHYAMTTSAWSYKGLRDIRKKGPDLETLKGPEDVRHLPLGDIGGHVVNVQRLHRIRWQRLR